MKQRIYLAGGLRSNWQEKVTSNVEANFYNPREKEVDKELPLEAYKTWDLHHVKDCDLVFAYMEKTNPSGIGMSVELGYAKALGKTVILCLEENNEFKQDRYLQSMKMVADIVFTDFEKAVEYLKLF